MDSRVIKRGGSTKITNKKNIMIPKLYTKQETADILRIHITTLTNYIREGKIRSTKQGRFRFFTEEHINEFIKNGEG